MSKYCIIKKNKYENVYINDKYFYKRMVKNMLKEKFLKVVTASACIASLILPHTSIVLAAALTNEKNNEVNTIKLISSAYHEGGDESSQDRKSVV